MGLILDRSADVYRLTLDSGSTTKESYVAYAPLANVSLNIQPAQAEDVLMADGVFGHTWIGFTTYSGILPADKLVIQVTGEVLLVKGKQNWQSPALAPYTELLLTEFETTE